ncbi:ATP-binding protein [Piscinibacter sp. HJYY11]|uniref:ATP-binding protein n=1 Tax=Piscinibacter sp. HJYY11 TaxID=2801333 RepID=UPI0019200C4A|nr:ATP-binding protein [Piscinibacter sp. HJYY11]MBL0727270.1 response regulator [Piscinibacter sp. HJYY11]
MKPRSLRLQLARAALTATLVALLLSTVATAWFEFAKFRSERQADLQSRADVLAYAIAPALVFNDRETVRLQLAALRNAPELDFAVVYRLDGSTFATFHSNAQPGGTKVPMPRALGFDFSASGMSLAQSVRHDDEEVGRLYMSARHDLWSRIGSFVAIQACVLVIALALAAWLFRRLQVNAVQSLADVTRVARRVTQHGDWSPRAQPSRYEELSVLVTAFNRMLDEVSQRTQALEAETVERRRVEVELRAADEQKDVFLATLAHELRNPLAPMTVAVSILRKKQQPQALQDKCVGILDRQLSHTVRLIDDLLDVSRIRVGKLTLQKDAIELLSVVRAAAELIEPVATGKQQVVKASLEGRDICVIADRTRLLQVFSNLLTNASRYTPRGGSIEVSYRCDDTHVFVSVRDTGIGIDASMQRKIFEMFQQADQSLERGNAGLGIGLTLASQLAQLHGGEIAVESEGLGRGACFTVRLPIAPRGTQPNVERRPEATAAGRPMSILIADDNVDAAVGLRDAFEALGHEVSVCHDGLSAVGQALARRFDAAILDIGMPGLNGYDAAQRIRAGAQPALVLVALTGWGQPSDKERARNAGFDHHFVKPASPDDLLQAIQARTAATRTMEDVKT